MVIAPQKWYYFIECSIHTLKSGQLFSFIIIKKEKRKQNKSFLEVVLAWPKSHYKRNRIDSMLEQ